MLYTTHYNLNLPEGSDIVNPLIQDNPNYSAIDAALYANKLRVIGNATEVKTGTSHAITRLDTDIPAFKFVATGDYDNGDTFTVDGNSVTVRIADGTVPKNKAYVINSTVFAILDGTILNLINVDSDTSASAVSYNNATSELLSDNVQGAIDETAHAMVYITTVTLTTGSLGQAAGSTGELFGVDDAHILNVYFERDSYSISRSCDIFTFGTKGYELIFTDNGSRVVNSTVRATIMYTLL